MSEIKNSFLNGHSLFGGLNDEQLSHVRKFLEIHNYYKDDILLTQGESNSTLFFIVSGSVSVVKHCGIDVTDADDADPSEKSDSQGTIDGNEDKELAQLKKGDSFGEMELIDIQPCAASVIALTDTEVITFTNYDLYKLSKDHPRTHTMIVMNLAREMSRRLRDMDERFIMELYRYT